MVKWFAKKYVLKMVNKALDDVRQHKNTEKYRRTAQNIVNLVDLFLSTVKDYKLDEQEADDLVKAVEALFEKGN